MTGGISKACCPPAIVLHQIGADRPADGARKAAKQRDEGHEAARLLAVDLAEGRERGIVESSAHADADDTPSGEVPRVVLRGSDETKSGRDEQGTEGEDRASSPSADRASDTWRDEASRQQSHG